MLPVWRADVVGLRRTLDAPSGAVRSVPRTARSGSAKSRPRADDECGTHLHHLVGDHSRRTDLDAPARMSAGAIDRNFLLQRLQPALSGLMDGSLSTLAPIFAVVLATHEPITAFFTGLATALGAGVSMAFSEGLSDTGDLTGRGNPFVRGAITGFATFVGGVFHTLPFLISDYHAAILVAVAVVAVELVALAVLRAVAFQTSFARSVVAVTVGGAIIAGVSSALGAAAS